jgi:predicted metal-dependent phosphoesterase TrpH
MAKFMNYESLHNHTKISDGAESHLEVLATAEKYGFGTIAFTDHDVLPNEQHLEELKSYKGPVKWFVGCEISSGLPKELGGGPTGMFHILGLFTDPFDTDLLEHSKLALKARIERMEGIVENLNNLGFTITVEDCLAASGGESIGRPHIVKALLEYRENIDLMEKLRKDMEKASENDSTLKKKYDSMMKQAETKGIRVYPYDIFLSEDAFIPNTYIDYTYYTDMDKSVELIRNAGGVAILAHWGTIKHKIDAEMLEQFLKEKRLDGVEVASGFSVTNEDNMELLKKIANKTNSMQTIGIDAHRPDDFKNFANSQKFAKQTIGMTQSIIEQIDPLLKWSNIKL